MKLVKYFPNGEDRQSRPKDQAVPAIIVGVGKRSLPTKKDEDGNVVETKEVDCVNLQVFQDDATQATVYRKQVVGKSDSESTELNYKLPYYEEI